MCSLTTECVLLLQNVFSHYTWVLATVDWFSSCNCFNSVDRCFSLSSTVCVGGGKVGGGRGGEREGEGCVWVWVGLEEGLRTERDALA